MGLRNALQTVKCRLLVGILIARLLSACILIVADSQGLVISRSYFMLVFDHLC